MRHITLILHNIRSTHNVGSMFRTSEGLGIEHIVLSGYTPYPTYDGDTRLPHESAKLSSQIHKTALGAETLIPFTRYEQLETWLEHNQSNDRLPLIALEQSSRAVLLKDFIPPTSFALLVGEEVAGIDREYLDLCDAIIEIPMRGQKESFNVSVSAAIALYALTL